MMSETNVTPRRVVVLGAAGFLGSSMTRYLAGQGHQVVAYWRQPRTDITKLPNVTPVVGDLRDTWILAEAFEDADVLLYMVEIGEKALKDETFFQKIKNSKIPVLLLLNKIDTSEQAILEEQIQHFSAYLHNYITHVEMH